MENEIISKYTKTIMGEMKAGNKERANVFKLIKAKMMEFVTRSDKPVLDVKAEITILNKMVKERKDTATEYSKAGRQELANQELFEANVISELLPKAASEEDIKKAISYYISSNGPCTIKQMGAIIKHVKSNFDNVDGALTSKLVKESLS